MSRIRIGTVGYLNSAPLTRFLDPERFELIADHPRGISERLSSGDVALALAPVASVLSDGDFRIVPGWCVGALGPVSSVLLVAETPPEAWTEVVLDGESRSSVTLARLLMSKGPLRERLSGALPVSTVAPGASVARAVGTTAAVVIGDAARTLPDRLVVRLDLAQIWTEWTGLPFVFAVWAGRPDAPQEAIDAVRAAGAVGVQDVAARYVGDDLTYLTAHIRYPLDEAAMVGLRRYAALAFAEGLIGTEHVRLFEPRLAARQRDPGLQRRLAAAVAGERLSAAELARVMTELPAAELHVAAAARRRLTGPGQQASYAIGERVQVEALDEAQVASLQAGAVVSVVGLAAASVERQVAALSRLAAAGLQPELDGLDELAVHAVGVGAAVRLGVLRAAGLAGVCWHGDAGTADLAVEASSLGLALRVELEITEQESAERWAARLEVVRAAMELGAQPLSVSVRLPLPEGSLVAPGAPTTARWLSAVASVRLFFPDLPHVLGSPDSQGLELSQLALFAGADDLGVVGAAVVEEAERLVRVAGWEAVRRDLRHVVLGGALTPLRKVRRPEERAEP